MCFFRTFLKVQKNNPYGNLDVKNWTIEKEQQPIDQSKSPRVDPCTSDGVFAMAWIDWTPSGELKSGAKRRNIVEISTDTGDV